MSSPIRVLILGAGGHGQVVADILLRSFEQRESVQPIGYLDDDPALAGQTRLGLPVFGRLTQLGEFGHDALIIAIGNNALRRTLYDDLTGQGEQFVVARHPRAVIAPDVIPGSGSMICAGVVVNPGAKLGANVILNTGCTVDHHNVIADHVHIAPGAHLGGDVSVGAGTLIGIGATVMPGRTLGAWSTVGAGALVTKDMGSGVVATGVPARIMRRIQNASHGS